MQRKYVDSSNFHAVLEHASVDLRGDWPDARAYFDTSQVRSPYKHGFYQDNNLSGALPTRFVLEQSTVPRWFVLSGSFLLGYLVATKVFK